MMTDPKDDPATASWHLDKRLNLGLIVALVMHAGSSLWWVSTFATRTETRLESAERRLAMADDVHRRLAEVQAALATQMASQAATVQAIATLQGKLDQRVDNLYRPQERGR